MVADLATFLAGDTGPLERQLEAAMQRGVGRPRLRAGRRPAGQARGRPGGRRRAPDGARPARGPRRAGPGRGRARGRRAGVPRPGRPGRGPLGPLRRQGRGPGARRSWSSACWSTSTPTPPPGCPARSWCRPCRPTSRPWRTTWPTAGAARWPSGCRVRGPKAALLETVQRNAGDAFVRHRLQRTSDHNSRARALEALQRELRLPDAPLRIECYDMSHLQGTDYVGLDGGVRGRAAQEERLPPLQGGDRGRQRRLRGHGGGAHPPAHRPARRGAGAGHRRRGGRPTTGRTPPSATRRRFAYPPQLLLLDGGLGQLARGHPGARAAGPDRPGPGRRRWPRASRRSTCRARRSPVRLPRQSEALYLLQRLRDEAHRFAISYHRTLRGKRMTVGALDGVPGLGRSGGAGWSSSSAAWASCGRPPATS